MVVVAAATVPVGAVEGKRDAWRHELFGIVKAVGWFILYSLL